MSGDGKNSGCSCPEGSSFKFSKFTWSWTLFVSLQLSDRSILDGRVPPTWQAQTEPVIEFFPSTFFGSALLFYSFIQSGLHHAYFGFFGLNIRPSLSQMRD